LHFLFQILNVYYYTVLLSGNRRLKAYNSRIL